MALSKVLCSFASIVAVSGSRLDDPIRTTHEGHQAQHVVRLHRLEGAGDAAMIEAEARWSDLKTGGASKGKARRAGESAFVKVSAPQYRALKKYHEDYYRLSSLYQVKGEEERSSNVTGHGHSLTVHAKQVDLGDTLPVTPLQRLSSQYVGPVGVGTVIQPDGCAAHAQADALIFIPRDADSSTAQLSTCHTSEQTHVQAVYDTGSTNIWIASDLCKTGPCAKPERSRYDHVHSSTFKEPKPGSLLHIRFGTGEVSGPQALDDFHIGPFSVYKQTFGMIQEEDGAVFEQVPFEGIVGLGFPAMSANGVTPFFDNVIKQGALKKNEFAFYFSKDNPSANAILWGGVDKKFHDGDIEFFPVVQPYYWSLKLKSFKIGDETLLESTEADTTPKLPESDSEALEGEASQGKRKLRASSSSKLSSSSSFLQLDDRHVGRSDLQTVERARAIVDTGTTYFTAESGLYDKIMARLDSKPCSQVTEKSHPDLTYRLENTKGEHRDFVLKNSQYMVEEHLGGSEATCSPAFMQINIPKEHGPGMILGEVFLRHYFSVFDRVDGNVDNARVGFAKARQGEDVHKHLQELTTQQVAFTTSMKGKTTEATV